MGNVAHFAINADDLDRARTFYASVFGWRFEPWGPPGFFRIITEDAQRKSPLGALQQRRSLSADRSLNAFECTIAVDDVDRAAREIVAQGGRILMPKATIPGVGALVFFEDTEGNIAGAMQYE